MSELKEIEEKLDEIANELRGIKRNSMYFIIAYIVFWTIIIFLMHVFHVRFGG